MAKTKKKLTKEEKLAKDRERKRLKYIEIKGDPELYKIQKKKDRMAYLKKKEKKKVCSVKELSARAQRELRKRWRKNSLTYLRKKQKQRELEKILVDNSPPESDNDAENISEFDPTEIIEHAQDPLACPEKAKSISQNQSESKRHCKMTPSSSTRKFRYRAMKTIKNLKEEIEQIKKDKILLQKKTKRLQEKLKRQTVEDSLEKNVNNIIKNIQGGKVEEAKKKLLFDETMSRGLTIKYKTLNKGEKKHFAEDIIIPNKSRLSKHKLMSRIPFSIRKSQSEAQKNRLDEKKQQIEDFFEDDVNSRVAAGKDEFVKKGNTKKQKRYLTDNLKNLHVKYCAEKENISYSVFCKYRPYWVVFPKDERDTCQCKLHANVNLLIKASAFRRFIARRGCPKEMLSDNGTTFHGAANDLTELYDFLKAHSNDLATSCARERIQWKFLPPYTPHMGGLHESSIKRCKFHLKRILGQALLTYEEFLTILVQVEGILNSRPLCPIPNSNTDEVTCLTPAHFLIFRTPYSLPDYDYKDVPTNRLSLYQQLQQLQQDFWNRWSRDYIGLLQERTKWRSSKGQALRVGAVVLVREERLPPCLWRLGRIVSCCPGRDGVARVAEIQTARGIIKRSFNNICPLPINAIDP